MTLNDKIRDEVENVPVDDSATEWKFVGRRVTCKLKKIMTTCNDITL